MDEAPTCAVYALEKIGEYEPFCYTMLILRRAGDEEVIIINTGSPEGISHIRKAWQDWDARCHFERQKRHEGRQHSRGVRHRSSVCPTCFHHSLGTL